MDPQRKVPRIHCVDAVLGERRFHIHHDLFHGDLARWTLRRCGPPCCTLRYSSIHPWRPGLGGGAGYSSGSRGASDIRDNPNGGTMILPNHLSAGSIWIIVGPDVAG